MKRILITGAESYIGTSFEKWLEKPQFVGLYQVDTLDMRKKDWKIYDFSTYDSIFHVAGIAHTDIGKVTEEQKKLYYAVNCDLAAEAAIKAKTEGVKQFIYMSSIIVYGEGSSVRKKKVITRETEPSPSNFYGDSKWRAEQKLKPLSDENFRVAILRPPMIYGSGCKGNYRTLEKIATCVPVFPDFQNQRSVCSVEVLCEFIRNLIESQGDGVYFPQDPEYMRTAEMVKRIAERKGKKIFLFKGFNWSIYLMSSTPGKIGRLINKAFGNQIYLIDDKNVDNG